MLIFILFCAVPYAVFSTDCIPPFSQYLQCVADSTGDYSMGKVLEKEFDDDFVTLCGRCFDPADNNGTNTKCILSTDDLNTDMFGLYSPLAACGICFEYATEIKNKFFNVPEKVLACFREKFSAAVVSDLQPCIRTELGDQTFNIPQLPDFYKSTIYFMDLVLKGMSHRVMAYSRLGACKARYPAKAQVSSTCLDNATDLYPKYCSLSQTCKLSSVASDCTDTFTKTIKATCKCLDVKRDEWLQRLDKVHYAVFNPQHSSGVCASGVKAALGHWIENFEDIFDGCMRQSSDSSIKLIFDLCIQADDDSKQKPLKAGFRMVGYILNYLTDRVTNFCSVDCF